MSEQPTATHTVPTVPSRYGEKGHYHAAAVLTMGTRSLGVGGWDATGEGRVVDHGPMVPGPVAYAFLHATVISDRAGAIDERERIEVADGDTLAIEGSTYRVRVLDHYGNVALDLIDPIEPTDADTLETIAEQVWDSPAPPHMRQDSAEADRWRIGYLADVAGIGYDEAAHYIEQARADLAGDWRRCSKTGGLIPA